MSVELRGWEGSADGGSVSGGNCFELIPTYRFALKFDYRIITEAQKSTEIVTEFVTFNESQAQEILQILLMLKGKIRRESQNAVRKIEFFSAPSRFRHRILQNLENSGNLFQVLGTFCKIS